MLEGTLYEWGLVAWIGGLLLVACIDAVKEHTRRQVLNGWNVHKHRPPDISCEDT